MQNLKLKKNIDINKKSQDTKKSESREEAMKNQLKNKGWDDELIVRTANLDTLDPWLFSDTIEEILQKFYGLSVSLVKKYFKKSDSYIVQDIMEDLKMKIYELTKNYDHTKNMKYPVYMKKYLEYYISDRAGKYYKEVEKTELYEKVNGNDKETLGIYLMEEDNYKFEMEDMLKCLKEDEKEIVKRHIMYKEELKDVAKEMGISYSTAKRRKESAIQKLRKNNYM